MKILILGGTQFLGIHLVTAALKRGHEITLFNRGKTNPNLYPELEKLRGNRDGDLSELQGRKWDAVIDVCGFVPRIVEASAKALSDAIGHYTFISSISVYTDFSNPKMDENSPLGQIADPTTEEVTNEAYGPLKVLCERNLQATIPGKVLIVRPGIIVGPHDVTDRFPYWVRRVARGGEVLAPGMPERSVVFIDGRDLAHWIIQMVELRQTGIYNTNGPGFALSMGQMLEECKKVSGSDAHFTWVNDEFLEQQGIKNWPDLPLWLPRAEKEYAGLFNLSSERAIAKGLTYRPLDHTIHDTLSWEITRLSDGVRTGLEPAREAELLKMWHKINS